MPKKKKTEDQSLDLFEVKDRLKTAVCVPAIRKAVQAWKLQDYPHITATTRELLNYWFYTDHRLANGTPFKYHQAQREAIETLIYLYEVARIYSQKELLEQYAQYDKDLRLASYDHFARYCIKMATGSGKTKVMAMAIVWQYANALRGEEGNFAQNFLIIAPNVIVLERLKEDFTGGVMFQTDPLIPRHLKFFWEMQYYMRGEGERGGSIGALYLTNIQQFYEKPQKQKQTENDIMTAMLGSPPPSQKSEIAAFHERIVEREGLLMVLNDEAHHTHDEDGEWIKSIRNLHEKLAAKNTQQGINLQLDVSATPRYSKGSLFAWTVFDYPLKQAIIDGVVKRPIRGIANFEELTSNDASIQYRGYLVAGVERWKEYVVQLSPLNQKPILFIMLNDTKEADQVSAWLREAYPQYFGGEKLLTIHTNPSGDIVKDELDELRKKSREVDKSSSPVNAIVSVLMLREGWDVKNVTVVVGLRPYTAKANILPEQAIGRGLRLMFRHLPNCGYNESVDIIGNKKFIEFVSELEQIEDLKLDTFQVGKDKLQIFTIQPVLPDKQSQDIAVPEISSIIERKKTLKEEIEQLDVTKFEVNPLPFKESELNSTKSFIYEGYDIVTNAQLFAKEYVMPTVQTAQEIIGYYARLIAGNLKLPSQFKYLTQKIQEFFVQKAFGKVVDINDEQTMKAMQSNIAKYVVPQIFEKALRACMIEEKEPTYLDKRKYLSGTLPFPTSRKLIEASKTIFNYVVCDNGLEESFAKFLENAKDVKAFAKLPEQFGFCIQYTDTRANIRNYFPDFIVVLQDNSHWLVETKGREDIDVKEKDRAARLWCEKVSQLTGENWQYLKILQQDWEKMAADSFEDLQYL